MKHSRRFLLIFLMLLCFAQFGCSPATSITRNAAANGTIDLARWNFERDGITTLDGDWQFYWNQLLSCD
ncbi:MAG TPA: histidine kinase, partial [Alphaproteobacteria bacterium]|nr:histidine kinase [Alphaproteobacteria bacterium]